MLSVLLLLVVSAAISQGQDLPSDDTPFIQDNLHTHAPSGITPLSVMQSALAYATAPMHHPLLQPQQLYMIHAGQAANIKRQHARQIYRMQHPELEQHKQQMNGTSSTPSPLTLNALQSQQTKELLLMSIRQTLQHMMLMAQLRARQVQETAATNSTTKPVQADHHQRGRSGGVPERDVPVAAVHICVVVRTYQAHGPRADGSHPGPLRQLLKSLVDSGLPSWQALIVMSDGKPFPALDAILEVMNDPRIKIHTRLVGPEHSARQSNGAWNSGYHHSLFNITDTAIEACSPTTRWVTVTNGDNVYDPDFWKEVATGPSTANVLAFDFYSRYQRYTGRQCYRFVDYPDTPRCKENLLRFFHVDLASVAMDWKRWISEKRGFARVSTMSDFEKGQGWHDAFAIHALMESGWKVHWVGPGTRCLVAHSPSPQLCAMEGGVWDDSTKDYGGPECRSLEDGLQHAQQEDLQLIQIQLTHDPSSFVRPMSSPQTQHVSPASTTHMAPPLTWPPGNYTVPCIRQVHEVLIQQTWNNPEFYHRCCALLDQPAALLYSTKQQLEVLHALHAKSGAGLINAVSGMLSDADREEL